MSANSLEINNSHTKERVISIDSHRKNKASTKYNKPHCIIPVEDLQWIVNQAKNIQILWNECWASDQYGSRWIKLTTSLGDKAFRLARQVLYKAGLFQFKRETCIDDSRKTAAWLVINLHGARRIKEFWLSEDDQKDGQKMPDISDQTTVSNSLNNVQPLPNNSLKNPNDGQKMPSIISETIEKSSIPESLRNTSETSQELLIEVSEKKEERPIYELLDRVRKRAGRKGEKVAQKVGEVLERCAKRIRGESFTQDDYYKELFLSRYNWRIDEQRLNSLLELNQQCQTAFINRFKQIYEADGMSAPRTFDKAINFVTNNSTRITEGISRQAEYFKQVWERREQLFGNTALQV
ncbi:hypothetical protein [Nostoc sp. FACHB-110]|uniref:hypothetical protein n=1 Tax=Nostoc sp. FACHB-110 TaxID=2692834 RepID=UPI001685C0F4|nr:hypothetical protein [Nostoc sp. FACHB-110]MBD2438266.1 hypothetical protein [Nostoc sp. FACHB-110]